MPEINNETNLVEALRSKAEKTDIKQYLKSTLGGYTKSSVQEYLNVLRKQQQAMADTFSRNQQALFEEKESLKKNNDALQTRLGQVESEYRNLSETLRSYRLGNEEISASDVVALKNNIAALEQDLAKSGIEKSQHEQRLLQQDRMLQELNQKLGQAAQEKQALQEMLKAEMLESKNQRGMVSQLSGTIEEKNEEIKFLNSLMNEGQIAKLTAKISELMHQMTAQTEVMAKCNQENELKSATIETLSGENDTLRKQIEHLSAGMEQLSEQNDRLFYANQALADQLEEEYKRSIAMIREKSGITIDKLTAVKKLEEAGSKIAMLELEIQKHNRSEETDSVYENAEKTEKIVSDMSET